MCDVDRIQFNSQKNYLPQLKKEADVSRIELNVYSDRAQ